MSSIFITGANNIKILGFYIFFIVVFHISLMKDSVLPMSE